uniref:ATP synthase complex subunit 8 n=1 Tax=Ovalipes punctatus TaxID=331408 RepID=A0A4Y5SHA2_OVAPU|nr:ATP synthase F0 subunit 8 [Ovalipes punctatus]QDA22797.1 ATP synthase F0 subunit 8 [Ovalipes punctatus]
MPQMAPLMWLYLYCFFLLSLLFFLIINHFIKPYDKISNKISSTTSIQTPWKL